MSKTLDQIAKEMGVPVVEIQGKKYVHFRRYPEIVARSDNERIIKRLDLILELLKEWKEKQQ
jgi:type III secretory pathway component EscV